MFWKKNKPKPKTVTLNHYVLHFKTVDGEEHEFHRMSYCNKDAISCSPLEYYLIDQNHLQDDNDVLYPINNVIAIWAEMDDTIENVIERGCDYFTDVWYRKKNIVIYSPEE